MLKAWLLALALAAAVNTAGCVGGPLLSEDRAVVIAREYEFDPGTIHHRIGEDLLLTVKSEDAEHILVSKELGIPPTAVKPDQPGKLRLRPEKKGTYTVRCIAPGAGHANMHLTVVVE